MPILYKNNPMPLDGALFVTNPRRSMVMRENNAKDRFIRKELGMPLQRIKRIKSQDYSQYKELFEKAGGESEYAKRKKSKKARMNKFFAALPDGDTRGKKKGRKKSSSASRRKGSTKRASSSKKGMSAWQQYVADHAGQGLSMAKLADMARKEGVIGKKSKKKNPRRRNPLAPDSQAQRVYRQLAEKVIKGEKLTAKERKRFMDLEWANTQKDLTYTTVAASAKRKRAAASRASASKETTAKSPKFGRGMGLLTPKEAARRAVKGGGITVKFGKGGHCDLGNAWKKFTEYRQERKKATGRSLTNHKYYYEYLPAALDACVSMGTMTKEEAKKLLKEKRAHYNKLRKSKVSKSTSTRRTSVAKKSKSAKRVSKKITSLARAVNRGEIKASIKNKVKKGSMLKWGEFQQAFTGCGHTKKALGRMFQAYKKSHGAAPAVKRKSSKKKSSTSKRRKLASSRGKSSKSLSKITLEDIKKVLKRRSPKGAKTITGMRLSNLKEDQKKIIAYADRLRRKGDSKSAAISKALTYYRSAVHGKGGKVVKRKAATLRSRSKGLAQRYNPRRRRNSVKSAAQSVRPLDMLESVNQWVAGLVGNLVGAKQGAKASSIANTSLLLAEIAGAHYLLSKVPQIDEYANNLAESTNALMKKIPLVDYAAGAPLWLVKNGYYSIQGLVALGLIAGLERFNLVSQGSTLEWGGLAVSSGVMLDVAAKLFGSSSDLQGVHLNGYGDGGQYMVTAPQTIQMKRNLSYGAVHQNPGYGALSGAEGAMGAQGHQGASSYGAVLFSGSGY